MISRYHTTSINNDKTLLYIYNEQGNIIEVDLINGIFNISSESYHDGSHSRSLYINNEFNIFGGWYRSTAKSHYILNKKEKKLIETHKFSMNKNGNKFIK